MNTRDEFKSAPLPLETSNHTKPYLTFFKESGAIPLIHKKSLLHSEDSMEIFAAEMVATAKPVAIKKLKLIPGVSEEDNLREISINAILTHENAPHILPMKFYFIDSDHQYNIVTEYASEGVLHNWLSGDDNHPKLRPQQQKNIMCGIAKGLVAMHAANIAYGNLAPKHIILNEFLHPMLCDFGQSRRLDIDNDKKLNLVDIKYIAPEIFLKHYASLPLQCTLESDIYSLAIVCWQIVANANEFLPDITGITAWTNLVVKEDRRENIPDKFFCAPRVAQFITQGWAKKPEMRPSAKTALEWLSKSSIPTKHEYDTADVTIGIEFLQAKIDFFAAPFTDPEAFQEWSQANESAMSSLSAGLSSCLNSLDQIYAFKKALIGESAADTNCLRAGNKQPMKDFFLREGNLDTQVSEELRKNFLEFIIKQIGNPVINQWIRRNHPTNKCR